MAALVNQTTTPDNREHLMYVSLTKRDKMSGTSIGRPFLLHEEWDSTFKAIITNGWANRTDGDVESPYGHMALVIIEPADLPEFCDAFADVIGEISVPHPGSGYFTSIEDERGTIWVYRHATAFEAIRDYENDVRHYQTWVATNEVTI